MLCYTGPSVEHDEDTRRESLTWSLAAKLGSRYNSEQWTPDIDFCSCSRHGSYIVGQHHRTLFLAVRYNAIPAMPSCSNAQLTDCSFITLTKLHVQLARQLRRSLFEVTVTKEVRTPRRWSDLYPCPPHDTTLLGYNHPKSRVHSSRAD